MTKSRRPGRKSDPDAKRRQTTREGRGQAADRGTEELQQKRQRLAGDRRVGLDFPLDILLARRLITPEMRDEGLRFAMLAWWLYGAPTASCSALYERMVAEGYGAGDFTPRAAGAADPTEDELERIRSQKARFGRMVRALGGVREGDAEKIVIGGKPLWYRPRQPLSNPIFEAVRDACQFLERPALVDAMAASRESDPVAASHFRTMARLLEGLGRLVELRAAEDRHWRQVRARRVQELQRAAAEAPTDAGPSRR